MSKEDVFFVVWLLGSALIVWRFEAMNRTFKRSQRLTCVTCSFEMFKDESGALHWSCECERRQ